MEIYHAPGDKILDAGSGQNPNPNANVLLEKYKKNVSRGADMVKPKGKKIVYGDIQDMPFKNKEFDFVYCCHVLEHVDEPGSAITELVRVARAGYIETPTPIWELLFGRKYHKWTVKLQDKILFFYKNGHNKHISEPMDKLYSESWKFRDYFERNKADFYNQLYWKKKVEYIVNPDIKTIKI